MHTISMHHIHHDWNIQQWNATSTNLQCLNIMHTFLISILNWKWAIQYWSWQPDHKTWLMIWMLKCQCSRDVFKSALMPWIVSFANHYLIQLANNVCSENILNSSNVALPPHIACNCNHTVWCSTASLLLMACHLMSTATRWIVFYELW